LICHGRDILNLLSREPFKKEKLDRDRRAFLTVISRVPRQATALPIYTPNMRDWQVKVIATSGNLVLSLWRRIGDRILYPNEIVEKAYRAPSTTRSWNTIEKIGSILES
jgi:uncharacterized protein (DUF1697 family)